MMIFSAKVIKGGGIGKWLGFPTANLDVENLNFGLGHGVYLVKVKLGDKIKEGLMHWGVKKTFGRDVSCEVFIKNFNQDIYGMIVSVEVMKKIRNVKKFSGAEDLKKQIKKDLK
ncbi:MAG: riboflavin kinase [bacterium]